MSNVRIESDVRIEKRFFAVVGADDIECGWVRNGDSVALIQDEREIYFQPEEIDSVIDVLTQFKEHIS